MRLDRRFQKDLNTDYFHSKLPLLIQGHTLYSIWVLRAGFYCKPYQGDWQGLCCQELMFLNKRETLENLDVLFCSIIYFEFNSYTILQILMGPRNWISTSTTVVMVGAFGNILFSLNSILFRSLINLTPFNISGLSLHQILSRYKLFTGWTSRLF